MRAVSRRAAVTALLAIGVGACAYQRPPVNRLTIATGGTGGVYYALGTALARVLHEHWGIEVIVRRTGASIENLRLIANGEADLGFASMDAVILATSGLPPFAVRQPINSLALLYDDYLQVVTLASDSIHDLREMEGAAISVGASGSGTELVALRLLHNPRISKLRFVRLGVAESAEALERGHVRGFFFSGGLPTPAIASLARRAPIRLMTLDAYVATLQNEYNGVYVRRTVPAHTYNLPSDVSTIGVPNLLVTSTALGIKTAHLITRSLFESRVELSAAHAEARHLHERTAVFTVPVPLHPGAVRYYREVKYGVSSG